MPSHGNAFSYAGKAKTANLCPTCGGEKYRTSAECIKCVRDRKNKCGCGAWKCARMESCRACKDKERHRTKCESCGGLKDHRAKQCRSCRDIEPDEKPCRACGTTYPITEYSLRPNGRGGHKRRSRCKKCEAEAGKAYHAKYPERVKATKKRSQAKPDYKEKARYWGFRSSWKKMGFDPDKVKAFVDKHGRGRCWICGSSPGKKAHAIDHKHGTKKIRGILCSNCNNGIGFFKDQIPLLLRAVEYLSGRLDGKN